MQGMNKPTATHPTAAIKICFYSKLKCTWKKVIRHSICWTVNPLKCEGTVWTACVFISVQLVILLGVHSDLHPNVNVSTGCVFENAHRPLLWCFGAWACEIIPQREIAFAKQSVFSPVKVTNDADCLSDWLLCYQETCPQPWRKHVQSLAGHQGTSGAVFSISNWWNWQKETIYRVKAGRTFLRFYTHRLLYSSSALAYRPWKLLQNTRF